MKKFISTILTTALTLSVFPFSASASTDSTNISRLIPAGDLQSLVKVDLTEAPRILQDILLEEANHLELGRGSDQVRETLIKEAKKKPFYLATVEGQAITDDDYTPYYNPTYTISFIEIDEDTFNENMDLINPTIKEDTDSGVDIQCIYEYSCYAYQDGFHIEGPLEGLEVILNNDSETLAQDQNFLEINDVFEQDTFITGYVDYGEISDELTQLFFQLASSDTNIFEIYDSIAFSVDIEDDGIEINSKVKTDSAVVEKYNSEFSTSDKLSLYKHLDPDNLILFEDSLALSSEVVTKFYIEWLHQNLFLDRGASEQEIAAADQFVELMKLFQGETLTAVSSTEDTLPAFTIMTESSDPEDDRTLINDLSDQLWKIIKSEASRKIAGNETYVIEDDGATIQVTRDSHWVGDASLDKFEISISADELENDWDINLTLGVTDDGIVLITTDNDIQDHYGKSISNENVKRLLASNPQGTSYIDLQELNDYLRSIFEYGDNAILDRLDEIKTTVKVVRDNSILSSRTQISYDDDLYDNFEKGIEQFGEMFRNLYDYDYDYDYDYGDYEVFKDVPQGEWFTENINFLYSMGVINGDYDDQGRIYYHPANQTTRAEFIAMVIRSLRRNQYFDYCYNGPCEGDAVFQDIDDNSVWYAESAYTAQNLGIIKGDANGNFSADRPITRAEAAQILVNLLERYPEFAPPLGVGDSFPDVSESDWFYPAVRQAVRYEIFSGNGQGYFEPARALNRAEAAKVITNTIFVRYMDDEL